MKIRVLVISLAFCFSACSFALPSRDDSITYYELRAPSLSEIETPQVDSKDSLVVSPVIASGFIDSQRILFSADGTAKGAYQFSRWTDRVTSQFQVFLIDRLSQSSGFSAVSRAGSGSFGDFQLNLEILDFYHDVSSRPGKVVAEVRVEFLELTSRRVIASKHIRKVGEASGFNAEGAVVGLRLVTGKVLDEIVAWVKASRQQHATEAQSSEQESGQ